MSVTDELAALRDVTLGALGACAGTVELVVVVVVVVVVVGTVDVVVVVGTVDVAPTGAVFDTTAVTGAVVRNGTCVVELDGARVIDTDGDGF